MAPPAPAELLSRGIAQHFPAVLCCKNHVLITPRYVVPKAQAESGDIGNEGSHRPALGNASVLVLALSELHFHPILVPRPWGRLEWHSVRLHKPNRPNVFQRFHSSNFNQRIAAVMCTIR